jgi:hypothetical protein
MIANWIRANLQFLAQPIEDITPTNSDIKNDPQCGHQLGRT